MYFRQLFVITVIALAFLNRAAGSAGKYFALLHKVFVIFVNFSLFIFCWRGIADN